MLHKAQQGDLRDALTSGSSFPVAVKEFKLSYQKEERERERERYIYIYMYSFYHIICIHIYMYIFIMYSKPKQHEF